MKPKGISIKSKCNQNKTIFRSFRKMFIIVAQIQIKVGEKRKKKNLFDYACNQLVNHRNRFHCLPLYLLLP